MWDAASPLEIQNTLQKFLRPWPRKVDTFRLLTWLLEPILEKIATLTESQKYFEKLQLFPPVMIVFNKNAVF